jgi:chromosome segregation ATPase
VRRSSAQLFFVYALLGLFALLLEVIAIKIFGEGRQSTSIFSAIAISVSNLIAVAGYTRAIIRDKELLADQESADLAYYLGFCLTVGALSFSFLFDIVMRGEGSPAQMAEADSSLISGSLAQFGAGLLATLFGLSAKILITSLQTDIHLDPEDLYRKFRLEVNSFSLLLRDLSEDLKQSMSKASSDLTIAGKLAADSFTEISKNIGDSSKVIAENLSTEKIKTPVQSFSEQLGILTQPLAALNKNLTELNSSISESKNAFQAGSQKIQAFDISIKKSTENLDTFIASAEISVGKFDAAIEKIESLGNTVANTSNSVENLSDASRKTANYFDSLAQSAKTFSDSITSQSNAISALTANVNSIKSTYNVLSEILSEVNTELTRNKQINADMGNQTKIVTSTMASLGDSVSQILLSAKNLNESSNSLIERLNLNALSVDQVNVRLDKFRELFVSVDSTMSKFNSTATEIIGGLQALSKPLLPLAERAAPLSENLLNLSEPLRDIVKRLEGLANAVDSVTQRLNKA